MKSIKKIFLYAFLGISVLLFATLVKHSKFSCETVNLKAYKSIDGNFVANESLDKCGNEHFKMNVWLGKANSNEKWSVFSVIMPYSEFHPGHTPFLNLHVKWISKHRLRITYPNIVVPSTKEGETDGVFVEYRTYRGQP